jgi:Domain of unknown function (DUF4091)
MGSEVPMRITVGSYTVRALVVLVLLFFGVSGCSGSAPSHGVKIVSYQLRDRVFTLQQPMMRSSLIVGFRVEPGDIPIDRFMVEGELSRDGTPVGRDRVIILDGPTGSLGFDIPHQADFSDRERPYSIPDGLYTVQIRVKERDGRVVAQLRKEFRRNQLGRTFVSSGHVYKPLRHLLAQGDTSRPVVRSVSARSDGEDGTLFVHSLQERVFVDSVPDNSTVMMGITIRSAWGETQSVAVSLRGRRVLGVVSLQVSPLRSTDSGTVLRGEVSWGAVKDLNEVVQEDTKRTTLHVRRAPRLLESGTVTVGKDETRSFWLTIAIPAAAIPGTYHGSIGVQSRSGEPLTLPVTLIILPLTLPEPDIIYGMMMDYAFYELDNPDWSMSERRMLEKRGREIYQDLRDHGLSMAYPHSHFFYRTDERGNPVLDSLKAALQAYATDGFPGPFVWYLGHLLNTAKPKHPGSILLYDEKVAERRLRDLLPRLEKMAREAGVSKEKLVVQLVDEPDSEDRARTKAAKKLNGIAREMGFRTLITRPWPEVDIICTGIPDDEAEAARLRNMGKEWWIYPNEALSGLNLCYTRYVFGFGAWRWGVQGVVPWTYQMSQGSNGNPFTVLDGPEIMVTYPGKDGPISTPIWESIREGINDYRYICLLEKLITAAKENGNPAADRIEKQLHLLQQQHGRQPGFRENDTGDWSAVAFDKKRAQIAAWALELSQ